MWLGRSGTFRGGGPPISICANGWFYSFRCGSPRALPNHCTGSMARDTWADVAICCGHAAQPTEEFPGCAHEAAQSTTPSVCRLMFDVAEKEGLRGYFHSPRNVLAHREPRQFRVRPNQIGWRFYPFARKHTLEFCRIRGGFTEIMIVRDNKRRFRLF